MAQAKHRAMAKQWKHAGKLVELRTRSMLSGHAPAGVGFQHDHTALTPSMAIKTDAYQRIHDQGRVKHMGVVIDGYVSFTLYDAYGHVGGHHDATVATNTSRIVDAIPKENKAQGKGPAIICMDRNANPVDTNAVAARLVGSERWIDVGARASLWGGVANAPTCNTNGPNTGTGRDYTFVRPTLIAYIHQVQVHDDAIDATHARVEVTSRFNGNKFSTRTAGKITPLHAMNPNDDDGNNWRKTVGNAIEGGLHKEEHNSAAHHFQCNIEAMFKTWVRVLEEVIILATGPEKEGPAVPRGRGSPTITWALQQPALPQINVKTMTCVKERAERQQAICDIWEKPTDYRRPTDNSNTLKRRPPRLKLAITTTYHNIPRP